MNSLEEYSPNKSKLSLSSKLRLHSKPSTSYSTIRSGSKQQHSMSRTLPSLTTSSSTSKLNIPSSSETTMMFERLSGLYESSNYESFVDRCQIVHPLSICVRCSGKACLCMECSNALSDQQVDLFRKSQAIGAYHLFSNAIREAGSWKALRFVIFSLWKNSIHLQVKQTKRNEIVAERHSILKTIRKPFAAWAKYIQRCKSDRTDKKIDQLSEQIKLLSQRVSKLQLEKTTAEKQIATLQESNAKCILDIKLLRKKNKVLTKTYESREVTLLKSLHDDRNRILILTRHFSSLIPRILRITMDQYESSLGNVLKSLQVAEGIATCTPNFTRFSKTLTKFANSVEEKRENLVALLLAWFNGKSRSASCSVVLSSQTVQLDRFLPYYRDVKNLCDLGNGQQLCRVIVKTILELPPQSSQSSNNASKDGEEVEGMLTFQQQQLQDIKANANDRNGLTYLNICLMKNYLQFPLFAVPDFEQEDFLIALLSRLMLLSASIHNKPIAEELTYTSTILSEQKNIVDIVSKNKSKLDSHAVHNFVDHINNVLNELKVDSNSNDESNSVNNAESKFILSKVEKSLPEYLEPTIEDVLDDENSFKLMTSTVEDKQPDQTQSTEDNVDKPDLTTPYDIFASLLDQFFVSTDADTQSCNNVIDLHDMTTQLEEKAKSLSDLHQQVHKKNKEFVSSACNAVAVNVRVALHHIESSSISISRDNSSTVYLT